MFTTAAVPRPPRLDAKVLFLLAVLLASGLTFFAVCADAHAATPALRVNGLAIAAQAAPPEVSQATLWNDGNSLHWRTPDGRDETLAGPANLTITSANLLSSVAGGDVAELVGSMTRLAGELEVNGHKVVTQDDLAAFVYLDGLAALFGAAVGIAGCAWAMRRYAVVGLRARRWASRANRSLEQHQVAAARSVYR
jgi:hypothetical protein